MSVSVCMAVFNGMPFLEEQVRSVIAQLGQADELVVVDDASTDGSTEFLQSLKDPRVRWVRHAANRGHVKSFEHALVLARGQWIVMADQDDVWVEGRIARMVEALRSTGACLVTSNSRYIDAVGRPLDPIYPRLLAADSARHWHNIVGIYLGSAYYAGCAMALSRDLVSVVVPMPRFVESHDLWIAMAANLSRRNLHLDEDTLLRRIHGTNASVVRRPLWKKLASRLTFSLCIVSLVYRIRRHRVRSRKD